jgi:hypothetical protein
MLTTILAFIRSTYYDYFLNFYYRSLNVGSSTLGNNVTGSDEVIFMVTCDAIPDSGLSAH